jgi:hypothetical protein
MHHSYESAHAGLPRGSPSLAYQGFKLSKLQHGVSVTGPRSPDLIAVRVLVQLERAEEARRAELLHRAYTWEGLFDLVGSQAAGTQSSRCWSGA